MGIESITREKLWDIMSKEEIALLPENMASFTERLQSLLNQYIYSRKLEGESNDGNR